MLEIISQWRKSIGSQKGTQFKTSSVILFTFVLFFSLVPVEGLYGSAVSITFFMLFFILIVGVLMIYLTLGTLQARQTEENCSESCLYLLAQDLCYVAEICCPSWYNTTEECTSKSFRFASNFTQKEMLKAKNNWVGCEYDTVMSESVCERLFDVLH